MSDETQETQNLESAVDEATEAVTIQSSELDDLAGDGAVGEPIGIENLMAVPVRVTVQVGRTRMSLGELIELGPGSLIPLDREAHEPADILVNGRVVARGEVVTIQGSYGVRITSLQKDV